MIEGQSALVQTLFGTLLTWGLTALGAGLVFFLPIGSHRKLLDASLGFAAGNDDVSFLGLPRLFKKLHSC